jgi:hypothetical protein
MYGGLNSDGTWNGMIGMVMRGVSIIYINSWNGMVGMVMRGVCIIYSNS